MNTLHVFSKAIPKHQYKLQYIADHLEDVRSEDAWGTVKLHTGDSVYFRVVRSMEDAHMLSGVRFTSVEYHGVFDVEIRQYLDSRIRYVVVDDSSGRDKTVETEYILQGDGRILITDIRELD